MGIADDDATIGAAAPTSFNLGSSLSATVNKPQLSKQKGLSNPTTTPTPPKRRNAKRKVVDLTADDEHDVEDVPKKRSKKATSSPKKAVKETEEKRLRKFRAKAPLSYSEVYQRAVTQRMFVLDRQRTGTADAPSETIELAGTTGNIYTVTIDKVPSCDCPHARKGNQCKHIVYVMVRTLKAPYHLQYQLALLSSELREIFEKAPALPSEKPSAEDTSGLRKPVEDDCPICCVEFDQQNDTIVWCKAACGNNIHKGCFEQWATQKKGQGAKVTCPFCRSQWEGDAALLSNVSKTTATRNADGYMNVADQLGISGRRDYSTYHSFWVERQRREGLIQEEDGDYYWEDA